MEPSGTYYNNPTPDGVLVAAMIIILWIGAYVILR